MNQDVKNLKSIIDDLEDDDNGAMIYLIKEEIESLRNVYDYIERLERKIKGKEAVIDTLVRNDIVYQDIIREYEKDFISKDKIREKIKELEQCKKEELQNDDELGTHSMKWAIADYVIETLKELLEDE